MNFFAQANKPALSVPPAAPPSARTVQATGGFHCSRSLPGFPPPACPASSPVPPGTPHRDRPHSLPAVTSPPAAPLRFIQFAVLCLDADERREAPRLVYRLDTRGVGLYRRQPVAVPSVPRHLRFTRQRHPSCQITLATPHPFPRPAAQRVVEIAALDQWLAMLYPRVEHQTVLAVVVVVVGPLVVRPDNTRRDKVRLLRQSAVFIIVVNIVRILCDAVIRPRRERAVRV